MRGFDKAMGRVVVLLGLGLVLGIGGVLAVAALQAKRPNDRLVGLGLSGFLVVAGCLMLLGVFALNSRANRPASLLGALEALRARLGGEVMTASLLSPLVQPRLVTRVRGREVEVRAFRRRRGLVGLALGVPRWFFFVTAQAAPRAELYLVAPAWAREARLWLAGRRPVTTPRPLAGGAQACARDPSQAAHLLADPELVLRMERLVQAPGVMSVGVTPSPLGGLGAIVTSGLQTSDGAERLGWFVDEIVSIAERAG